MSTSDVRWKGREGRGWRHGECFRVLVVVGVAGMCVLGTGHSWRRGIPMEAETLTGPEVVHSEQTVAVLTYKEDDGEVDQCRLVLAEGGEDWDKDQLLVELGKWYPVRHVGVRQMVDLVEACSKLQPKQDARDLAKVPHRTGPHKIWTILSGIYPGTLWCGRDDIADNYYSLGKQWQLDKCCRAHDHCPLKVKSFSHRYGISNNSPFTKSYCACDNNFYNCLKAINSQEADNIGKLFFNTLGMQCVREKQPLRCVDVEDEDEGEELSGNKSSAAKVDNITMKQVRLGKSGEGLLAFPLPQQGHRGQQRSHQEQRGLQQRPIQGHRGIQNRPQQEQRGLQQRPLQGHRGQQQHPQQGQRVLQQRPQQGQSGLQQPPQQRTFGWFSRAGRQLKKKCLKWEVDKKAKPKLTFVNGKMYK